LFLFFFPYSPLLSNLGLNNVKWSENNVLTGIYFFCKVSIQLGV
jgi:hypothetical protein